MLLWVLLGLLTAIALVAVIQPLMRRSAAVPDRGDHNVEVYRDQLQQVENDLGLGLMSDAEADAARIEISRRLIADQSSANDASASPATGSLRKSLALAICVAVPAVTLGFYFNFGAPTLPGAPFAVRQDMPLEDQDLATLIAQAEGHLRDNPQDLRGWSVLAPAYMEQQRFADAAAAFARVMQLAEPTAELLMNYAEAQVLANQGLVTATAREAFARAITMDPSALRAEFYLGLADRQDGRPAAAIERWEALLSQAPPDAVWRGFVETHIVEARNDLGGAPQLSEDQVASVQAMSEADQRAMIEGMVAGLAERLEENGDDLDGWLRLANAYSVLGQRDLARAALVSARQNFENDDEALQRIEALGTQLGLDG